MAAVAHAPGRGATAAYAAGSFGTGVFSTVPTILLLYFCTEILRLPADRATIIVFVPKVWSIVWDPFVGAWSDHTSTRLGRRRPFLIAGTLGVVVSFVAVFTPPPLGPGALTLWMSAAYFMLATLYSLFAVPYVAIPAEVGRDPATRARLVSWRMFVAMIGVLTGAGLAPLIVEAGGGGRPGYAVMSLWVAGACAVAMSMPVWMLRGRDSGRAAPAASPPSPAFGDLFSALRDRRFVRFAAAYLLQLTAVGTVSSATPYLVTKCFGRSEGAIGTAMLAMLVVTTLAIPVWSRAGRRFGDTRVLRHAIAGYGALCVVLGALAYGHAPWPLALVVWGLLGAPFAAMQVLPYTIVAHLVHAESVHGRSAEGAYTGVWTATEKLGLALGPAITGLVLWAASGPAVAALAALAALGPPCSA